MEQHSQESAQAGPSHSSNDADPPSTSTTVEASPTRRTQRSSTPQSHPSPTSSRHPSRSPSTSRRSLKRTTFSPVPEESHLITQATSSSTHPPEPASKRPRPTTTSTTSDPKAARRGHRLFGVLTSTLSQFKRESETSRAASAASRRAEIEARSATKLALSSRQIDDSLLKRSLTWEARSIAEQIATGDSQRKTLRGLKRRMASFLYTPTTSRERQDRLASEIPSYHMGRGRRADEEGDFPLYFLPGKTLPEQEDALNDQEDSVDDKIDRFDDRWEEERSRLMQRLQDVKAKIRETF